MEVPFDIGDEILFGKYKNKRGKILRFGKNPKGQITVEIEPIPKGRKSNKELGLFKIWTVPVTEARLFRKADRSKPMGMTKKQATAIADAAVALVTADKVDPALLKKVQQMTDRNDHNAARIFVAEKVLKNQKLAKLYKAVDEIASILGSMPNQLGEFRYYVLDKQMLQKQLEQKGLGEYWGAM